jgi:hypothetical protein
MKKIIITDKSINALRIISYLKSRRIELKKIIDLKVDKMYETHNNNR